MLHAVHLVELLGKLRAAVRKDETVGEDFYQMLLDAIWKDGEDGDHVEIAKTMLEILEPERIGSLKPISTIFAEAPYRICCCCGVQEHPENTREITRRAYCLKCVGAHGLEGK